ncbi:MAG: ABC transporter substrate-binding protein [Polyangiales bacterium]
MTKDSLIASTFTPTAPVLGQLDVLGRVPVPLRRSFAAGMDRAALAYRAAHGFTLQRCLLHGAEWYRPFDGLAHASDGSALPSMLITTLQQDVLLPDLLAHYRPDPVCPIEPPPPAAIVRAAELLDPEAVFQVFAFVPFVLLVDETRLRGRPAPRTWADLLDPMWAGEVVFGGFRAHDAAPYTEFNSFLLECVQHEFGDEGLVALAHNVKHLQHNVRTATLAGSNSSRVGAIAVLPYMQAQLCPRRDRTRVVWPEDGALAMPIAYLVQPEAAERMQPVIDYLTGDELADVFGRNGYPATGPGSLHAKLADDARLKWPGWDYFRARDMLERTRAAAETFFQAWYGRGDAARSGTCG